jgi:predicted Zn-dependent protease
MIQATRRTLFVALLSLAAVPTLTSCTAVQNTLDTGHKIAANVLIPPAEEMKVGRKISSDIEKEVKLHDNPEIQAYIQELGARITKDVDVYEPITFKFKVIDDAATLNAMALPGGWVYVYTGLIMMAETEAELAGVIGHEIAHVTQRHVPQRLAAVYGVEALNGFVDETVTDKTVGVLADLASEVAANGYLLQYSRTQESEADKFGVGYMSEAGFNPLRFADFFARIAKAGQSSPELLSTHPDPEKRVKAIQKLAAALRDAPDYDGGEAFDNVQKLLWGPGGRPAGL